MSTRGGFFTREKEESEWEERWAERLRELEADEMRRKAEEEEARRERLARRAAAAAPRREVDRSLMIAVGDRAVYIANFYENGDPTIGYLAACLERTGFRDLMTDGGVLLAPDTEGAMLPVSKGEGAILAKPEKARGSNIITLLYRKPSAETDEIRGYREEYMDHMRRIAAEVKGGIIQRAIKHRGYETDAMRRFANEKLWYE